MTKKQKSSNSSTKNPKSTVHQKKSKDKNSKRKSQLRKNAQKCFTEVNIPKNIASVSSSSSSGTVTTTGTPSNSTESSTSINNHQQQQQLIKKLTPENFPIFEKQLRNEDPEFLDNIFGPDTKEVLDSFIDETRDYIYRRESSKVSLGFIGNTGVGKSTFINTLLVLSCIPEDHYPRTLEGLSSDRAKDYEVFRDPSLLNESSSEDDGNNSDSTSEHTEFNLLSPDHRSVEEINVNAKHPNETTFEKSYFRLFQNYFQKPAQYREKITGQKGFVLPQAETGETDSITNTMVVVKYGTMPHICIKYEEEESILDSLKSLLSSIILDSEDTMKVEKQKRYIMGITGWNESQLNECIQRFEKLPSSLDHSYPDIGSSIFPIRESVQRFIDKKCDVFLSNSGNLAQDITAVRNKLEEITKNEVGDSDMEEEENERNESIQKREEINQQAAIIEKIVVYLPCRILQNNVELIDIPGSNDSDPVKSVQLSKAMSDRTYLVLLTNKNFTACEQERKMLLESGFLDRLLPTDNNNNNNNNNNDDNNTYDNDKAHLFVFSNLEVNNPINLQNAKAKVASKGMERDSTESLVTYLKNYKGEDSDLSEETIRSVVQNQVTLSKICPMLMASVLMSNETSDSNIVEKLKSTGGYNFLLQLNRLVLDQHREAKKQFSGAKFTIQHIESNLLQFLDESEVSKRILKASRANGKQTNNAKQLRENHLTSFHRDDWSNLKKELQRSLYKKIESFAPCFEEENALSKTKTLHHKLMKLTDEPKRRLFYATKNQVMVSKIKGMKPLYWYFFSGISSHVNSHAKQINIEIRELCQTFVNRYFRERLSSLLGGFYPDDQDQPQFLNSAREYIHSNALPRIEESIRKTLCKQFGHFALGHTLFRSKCATALVEVIGNERKTLMQRDLSVKDLETIMIKVSEESWRLLLNALKSRMKNSMGIVSKKLFGEKRSCPSLLNSILHRFFKLLSNYNALHQENWLNCCLKEIMKNDDNNSANQETPEQIIESLSNFLFYRSGINSSGLNSPSIGKKRKRNNAPSSEVKEESPNKKRRITRSSKSL